ncbi:hypothetical protein RJ640_019861 [Escallonia rubra]|uniref:Uncharacterized protein n=1 Tax=Escallonia rubra TaxID=112253 RepID=A0AA88S221_9ASTE|nr:hypothetical protein RJ640_019861 [Escallonia rubra]
MRCSQVSFRWLWTGCHGFRRLFEILGLSGPLCGGVEQIEWCEEGTWVLVGVEDRRQLEQEMETVVKVLQPGPLGIIEHKFSAEEIHKAESTVKTAVENWRRNASIEQRSTVLKDYAIIVFSVVGLNNASQYLQQPL